MTKWLFIGPSLLAGIGQVTNKYAQLVGGEYREFSAPPSEETYDVGFAFVLPIPQHMDLCDRHLRNCTKKMYMTVCETETVHAAYGLLVERYKTLYTPSVFCQRVFERQFPKGNWKLLRHTAHGSPMAPPTTPEYTFYTIGNMADPRKNIRMLLEAFVRLDMPNTRLLLKATGRQPFVCPLPRVTVINDLLTDEQMDEVHRTSHCYINCSHSEGVGMGAVEAAVRDKPVIITNYGGLHEYIPGTPFVVPCGLQPVGQNDFLYESHMVWGAPVLDDLVRHMRYCAENRIDTWDHTLTRELIGDVTSALLEYSSQ
jgi:glycosyltransferase involved in cell wall biosynthesis